MMSGGVAGGTRNPRLRRRRRVRGAGSESWAGRGGLRSALLAHHRQRPQLLVLICGTAADKRRASGGPATTEVMTGPLPP